MEPSAHTLRPYLVSTDVRGTPRRSFKTRHAAEVFISAQNAAGVTCILDAFKAEGSGLAVYPAPGQLELF